MDECGEQKPLEAFSQHDIIAELCQSVPENARQAFAEKLAGSIRKLVTTLGAEPRAVRETTFAPSTAIVISSGTASNTDQTSQKMLKPGPSAAVGQLSTIRPALKDLVCYAVPRIAAVWYDVGLQLDLESDVLDEIEKEKSDQPRRMFAKWLQGPSCSWQSVLNAVKKTRGAKPMEDICAAVVKSIEGAQSADGDLEAVNPSPKPELTRKRRRSSTRSSEDLELQQSVAKKRRHDYMEMKMDLLAQDISDLQSESDPGEIIRLLYSNLLTFITKLLAPHLPEVKVAADKYCKLDLHQEVVAEGAIASVQSVDSLFSLMSVTKMWDNTRFLRKAVGSIPVSAPERQAAEAILSHYKLHLAIYEKATLLKDALAKKIKNEVERTPPGEDTKLVPLKITSQKALSNFSCKDCYCLQVQILSTAYGIPEEKIICHDVEECQSTTVTFLIPGQFTHDIIQRSAQMPTVWILLEISIIEVSIPGVFTFSPSVDCLLTLLRGKKTFTADLLGLTEVLPYQMYCLLDSDSKEPLSGRPLSTKRFEQHWDSHDEIWSRPQCSVPESENDVILVMHSDDATVPMEGTGEADELQSKVSELEAKVKDLERKVADLFMDNVALKTKLEASRKVEKQQREEITSLEERLVQALRAQETVTEEQSLSKTRESQLEAKVKLLREAKSDLEAEVEQLEKRMKQLEILPRDPEQLTKVSTQDPSADHQEDRDELSKESTEETPTAHQEPSTDELEAVARELATSKEGTGKHPTEESSTAKGPIADQQEAVRGEADMIREEARKGSTGETSAVPDQLAGVPTAATGGSQPLTQVAARPPVVEAARLGQLSTVRQLLNGGTATVDDQDEEGMTALLWASGYGHLALVRELVDVYKVNVFQKNKNGLNAMHVAAEGGQLEVIKFLSPKFGDKVHEKTKDSYTMLHWAAQEGHCEVARYLIEELKMDPQDRDKWGTTALLRAADGGNVSLVKMLIEEFDCSLDEVTENGLNAMHKAAAGGHLEMIKFLSPMFGTRVHKKTNTYYTMLHWAAQEGHCEVARYLIEELKMDPQDRDKFGFTALLRAAYHGHAEVVRMLKDEFGSSLEDMNNHGWTAVLLTIVDGHLDLLRELVEHHRADLYHKTKDGRNALHIAAFNGHLEVVKYLIPKFGQRKFDKDNAGKTCLDRAFEKQKHNVVNFLSQEGGFSGQR